MRSLGGHCQCLERQVVRTLENVTRYLLQLRAQCLIAVPDQSLKFLDTPGYRLLITHHEHDLLARASLLKRWRRECTLRGRAADAMYLSS